MASTNGHARPSGEVDRTPLEFFLAHHRHLLPPIVAQRKQMPESTLGGLMGPETFLQGLCCAELWKILAWHVLHHLETIRVPEQTLEALFARVLPSMPLTPSISQWLQIALALTPPFFCVPFGEVHDARRNSRRKSFPAAVCRGGAQLETALVEALVDFDERMRFTWIEYPLERAQKLTEANDVIEQLPLLFEILQALGLLPQELKGRRKDAVTTLCRALSGLVKPLIPIDWYKVEFSFNRKASYLCYGTLVRSLQRAFLQHGPPRWSDSAIAATLSAILSPLLASDALHLRERCTTPGAIRRYFPPRP